MQSRQQPISFLARAPVPPWKGPVRSTTSCHARGKLTEFDLRGGSAAKLDYPLNEASVSHLAQVILDIQNTYLKDTQVHCYYSIVPDKNAYLAGWYPTMDYHRLTQQLEALLPMTYVDLFPCLTGDSYYRTDPHWRQDALQPVVEALTSAMDVPLSWDLTAQDAGRFSGAYTGQSGLPLEPDRLRYLTGSALASCTARDLEGEIPLYDWEKAQGRDPYEFFPLRRLPHSGSGESGGLIGPGVGGVPGLLRKQPGPLTRWQLPENYPD